MSKMLLKDTSHPKREEHAEQVRQFEAEYGEDWESTMIEYDNDFVSLPLLVFHAAHKGNFRTVLQWLVRDNIKERANAKCQELGNPSLLYLAASVCVSRKKPQHDLMSYLLLNGADVNILLWRVCADIDRHGQQ